MSRKSHIARVYKDGDETSDQWVDIQRLDEVTFESGRGSQYRKKTWTFDWSNFGFGGPGEGTKQIVDPKDENNFIDVPVRTSILVHEARGGQYQGRKHLYINTSSNASRQTHSRRVYHHDILGDQAPSEPDQYLNALGEQDKEQYIDVELVDKFWTDENEHNDAQGQPKPGTWQEKRWGLNKDDDDLLLKDPMLETDEIDPDFVITFNPDDGPIVDPPWRLDPLQNIVNVSWGAGICRFAVVGYDGTFEGPIPVFSGFGAYSDDGKSWTTFRVFPNGATASIFNMRDPNNPDQNIVVVGGSKNQDLGGGDSQCTSSVVTIEGTGPSQDGRTVPGRNSVAFGGIGYDKKQKIIYASDGVTLAITSIGIPDESPPVEGEVTILWAGAEHPGIGPVKNCTCSPGMIFKDKGGTEHTLLLTDKLLLDGEDITPPGDGTVASAAGGANNKGEIIVIAVGFKATGEGVAWWSTEDEGGGRHWTEIAGLWTGDPALHGASMATAVTL